MRILLVSYFFPPFNTIGAVRTSKIAKYLTQFGHEVRVITAKDQPLQSTLPLEISQDLVTYTNWIDVNKPVAIAFGGRAKIATHGYVSKTSQFSILKKAGLLYKTFLNFPDGQIGWFPFALSASTSLFKNWQPDLIYASAKPFTSLIVARSLSKQYDIPWVAELRDPWVDNHCYLYPNWRQKIERRLEQQVLESATGLVTVSQPWADTIKTNYGKPTVAIPNGFDLDDYPTNSQVAFREGVIQIVYTGMIYDERKQDPTPLLKSLRQLGQLAQKVRVAFYGRYLGVVRELAKRNEVEHLVDVHEPVSYKEALKLQSEADILLLLHWNDPQERGVYPGKVFEYIGAKRPILAIGSTDDVSAELIQERNVGVVLNDSTAIATQLKQWIEQKQQQGCIPSLSVDVTKELSRKEQTLRLQIFLKGLIQTV